MEIERWFCLYLNFPRTKQWRGSIEGRFNVFFVLGLCCINTDNVRRERGGGGGGRTRRTTTTRRKPIWHLKLRRTFFFFYVQLWERERNKDKKTYLSLKTDWDFLCTGLRLFECCYFIFIFMSWRFWDLQTSSFNKEDHRSIENRSELYNVKTRRLKVTLFHVSMVPRHEVSHYVTNQIFF